MAILGYADISIRATGLKELERDLKASEKAVKNAALAVGTSAIALGASILKIGMPFEQMVLDAGAAMRATSSEMAALEAAARKAGATTEHTATMAAESLKFLGKAGLDAGQAMAALPAMMNFKTAIGDLMSLGQATDVVTDSMTAMGLGVQDLAHLTDLFIAVSNRSSTDSAKLGESFTKVAGIARLYGTSVEDLTALLGIQASAGIKAELAGTQLKNAFINTSRAAKELGIENKGLIPTLEAVAAAHWDADKIASVYGKIAMPSVVAILSKISGTDKGSLAYFREELSHASDGMGEAATQAEKMRQTVQNQFAIVVSQVEDLALSIYNDYKPAILEALKTFQKFVTDNKDLIISLVKGFEPLLKIVGVGGALVLGFKAVLFIMPVVTTAINAFTFATQFSTSIMTAFNTQLFGVPIAAKLAAGAIGVLQVAMGALFAFVAGWQIGSYLYDQFEEARLVGLAFVDSIITYFIEAEYASKLAWAAIAASFGVMLKGMVEGFAVFTSTMAKGFELIGGDEIANIFKSATSALDDASKGADRLTDSISRVSEERKKALATHEKTIELIALEHQGIKTGADAAAEAGNKKLAILQKQAMASQAAQQKEIDNLNIIAKTEIEELEKRIKAQEDFFAKTGIMGEELYKKRLQQIDDEVTQFRLGGSDEIKIAEYKAKAIEKLNAQYRGKTEKQIASESKAKEKAIQKELEDFFGFLDKHEKAVDRSLKQEKKAKEAALKEIAKLESAQLKEFEKTLGESQKSYENFLGDQLGIKEISAESQAEIDREYARIFADVQAGNIDSFDAAMTAILEGKELNINALKENDALYSVFLREQEAANREIRLDFYKNAGVWSEEYYNDEISKIENYSEKVRAAGVDAVTVEREKTKRLRALYLEQLESQTDFWSGFRLEIEKSKDSWNNWANAGANAAKTLKDTIAGGLTDIWEQLNTPADTSELEAQLKDLEKQYDEYAKDIEAKNIEIAESQTDTQKAINAANRELLRAGMNDFEKWQDDKLAYTETIADAEKQIALGNHEEAKKLFESASDMAGGLAREVKSEIAITINEISSEFASMSAPVDEIAANWNKLWDATAGWQTDEFLASVTGKAAEFSETIKGINLSAAMGDAASAKKAADALAASYKKILQSGEKTVDALKAEWKSYYDEYFEINRDIEDLNKTTDEKIRDMRRSLMDDEEKWADQKLEYEETYAKAVRELQAGNYEYSEELFRKSMDLAGELAENTNGLAEDLGGNLAENTAIAIELMQSASSGATDAMLSYQQSLAANMSGTETAIQNVVGNLGAVTATLGGLETAGSEVVMSLGDSTAEASRLMTEAGMGATTALELEKAAMETNMAAISTQMDALKNDINAKSNDMSVNWRGVWSNMLGTVVDTLAQMAAQFAAQKITEGAMSVANMLFAEQGVFDAQRPPGQPTIDDRGGFLSVLHPGETVLPEGLTESLKSSTGFDEWSAKIKDYFGFGTEAGDSLWTQVSDYSGAGGSLYDAWNKFSEGDNVGGIVDSLNAMSEAFKTYGQQYGSEAATNIGAGLGSMAGAVSSGYGAYTSFEAENYLNAATQAVQTVQSLANAYSLTTSGTTTTIGGAGLGGALAGAGYGSMAWNALAYLGEIESGDKAEAQWGAAAGGAIAGSAFGGALGSMVGGLIGGTFGSLLHISGESEFDLSDMDPWINANRSVENGKIPKLPDSIDPSWFGVTQQQYIDHLNLQADAVNAVTDTIWKNAPPDVAKEYVAKLNAQLQSEIGSINSGGNYNRNRADWAVLNVGNYYWKNTLDAIDSAISATSGMPDTLRMEIESMISRAMPEDYINPVDTQENIRREFEKNREIAESMGLAVVSTEEARAQRMEVGGAATGGIVVPSGEDGILGVKTGEGILPTESMQWIEDVGNSIQKYGMFGGVPAFQPEMPKIGAFSAALPETLAAGRAGVLSDALLNDLVSKTTETNSLLSRAVSTLEAILTKNPKMTVGELVDKLTPELSSRAMTGRLNVTDPSVKQAADTINRYLRPGVTSLF